MTLEQADQSCVEFQKMYQARVGKTLADLNADTAALTRRIVREDGVVYVNDLCYGTEYPASFLDIWYPDDTGKKRPTAVYFHGGGFLFGDKVEGDPLAAAEGGFVGFMERMIREDCNLVSVNYAVAPAYRFPAQPIQGHQALTWLVDHAGEYDLDMDRVAIMGSSAGANMTLLLAASLANPEYAAALGIGRMIEPGRVKALIADESVLSCGGSSEWIDVMSRSVLGEEDVVHSKQAQLYAAQNFIRAPFFPTFVNASNVDPVFYEDACHTVAALKRAGAPYELFYRTQEEAGELHHGFVEQFRSNPASAACMDGMLAFLKKYL